MTTKKFDEILQLVMVGNPGITQGAIARELGYNEGFISQMLSRGKISERFVKLMVARFKPNLKIEPVKKSGFSSELIKSESLKEWKAATAFLAPQFQLKEIPDVNTPENKEHIAALNEKLDKLGEKLDETLRGISMIRAVWEGLKLTISMAPEMGSETRENFFSQLQQILDLQINPLEDVKNELVKLTK